MSMETDDNSQYSFLYSLSLISRIFGWIVLVVGTIAGIAILVSPAWMPDIFPDLELTVSTTWMAGLIWEIGVIFLSLLILAMADKILLGLNLAKDTREIKNMLKEVEEE